MDRSRPPLRFRPLPRSFAWAMVAINLLGTVFAVFVIASTGVVTALPLLTLWQVVWAAGHLVAGARPALARRLWALGWGLAGLGVVGGIGQGVVWLVRQSG